MKIFLPAGAFSALGREMRGFFVQNGQPRAAYFAKRPRWHLFKASPLCYNKSIRECMEGHVW